MRRPHDASPLTLAELEAVRLLLRGGSVLDWYRMNCRDEEDVYTFLALLEVDPFDPATMRLVDEVRHTAVQYLADTHGYRVPDSIVDCGLIELFLMASGRGRRRDRFFACLLLKAAHIIFHVRAREARFRLALSQDALAQLLIEKVGRFCRQLERDAFPLVRVEGGTKSDDSMYTKLLMKAYYHAASITDLVRFRLVVENPADIVPLIRRLVAELVPVNYVVPTATLNHLVNFTAFVESRPAYRALADELQVELGHEERSLRPHNEHSSNAYRTINFVVDMPLRVDAALRDARGDGDVAASAGVVFGLVEFQIVDEATARANSEGDAAHAAYKSRQLASVRARLERGLRADADGKPNGA